MEELEELERKRNIYAKLYTETENDARFFRMGWTEYSNNAQRIARKALDHEYRAGFWLGVICGVGIGVVFGAFTAVVMTRWTC